MDDDERFFWELFLINTFKLLYELVVTTLLDLLSNGIIGIFVIPCDIGSFSSKSEALGLVLRIFPLRPRLSELILRPSTLKICDATVALSNSFCLRVKACP